MDRWYILYSDNISNIGDAGGRTKCLLEYYEKLEYPSRDHFPTETFPTTHGSWFFRHKTHLRRQLALFKQTKNSSAFKMAGFLSTLRGGCKALFRSFTSTLSTVKKWFQHEITPIIQEIASFVHHLYHNYVRSFASQAFQFASDHLGIAIGLFCITVMACLWIMTTPSLYTLGFTILGT